MRSSIGKRGSPKRPTPTIVVQTIVIAHRNVAAAVKAGRTLAAIQTNSGQSEAIASSNTMSRTKCIACCNAADRFFEHALAALAVDIVLEIAGHRSDDFDLLPRQERGKVLVSGLFQDSEVAAVHDVDAERAGARHQPPEVRIDLRRAAGDIEARDLLPFKECQRDIDNVRRHLLGAVRARVDMAVDAALVAAVADIELQRIEPPAPDRRERNLFEQRQGLAHDKFAISVRLILRRPRSGRLEGGGGHRSRVYPKIGKFKCSSRVYST